MKKLFRYFVPSSWHDPASPYLNRWANASITLLLLVIVLKVCGVVGWLTLVITAIITIPLYGIFKLMAGLSYGAGP